jgi:hypothetical protein
VQASVVRAAFAFSFQQPMVADQPIRDGPPLQSGVDITPEKAEFYPKSASPASSPMSQDPYNTTSEELQVLGITARMEKSRC